MLTPGLDADPPGDARSLAAYAIDGRGPVAVERPRSISAAAKILAAAQRAGQAVVPWGGGGHQSLGNALTQYDLALDMAGLEGVIDHQPTDLTLTVPASATLAQINDQLARHGQFLPFEAENPFTATIGGIYSARVTGPLRAGYGTVRDYALWVEALSADGTLVHGGAKVVKNVAGYDLTKLYLGSLGSVGILTSICFKVLPLPPTRPTVLAGFIEPGALAAVLAELTSGRLAPSLVTVVRGPAAWGEPFGLAPWVLAIGADGPDVTTKWQVEQFLTLVQAAEAVITTTVQGDESLAVRQTLMTHRVDGEVRLATMVLPGQVPLLLETLAHRPIDGPTGVFAEAANGVVRLCWAGATRTPGEHPWYETAQLIVDLGGRWILERAPAAWKQAGLDVWGPASGERTLMRRLKVALDPQGTLAPGRFVGG